MTEALILACFWVLAATGVAFLPLRYQRWPGAALALISPVLIVWVWQDHGPAVALLCLAAVVSMFRKPIKALWQRSLRAGA